MKTLRRMLAFPLCLAGVLLPWRLRVIYSECMGWTVQFVYMTYVYTLKFVLKELEKAKAGGK